MRVCGAPARLLAGCVVLAACASDPPPPAAWIPPVAAALGDLTAADPLGHAEAPSQPAGGAGAVAVDGSGPAPGADSATAAAVAQGGAGQSGGDQRGGASGERSLGLDEVLASVTSRYPPYLSALLERDLAAGRLQSAQGGFDPNLSAKVGGKVQGYYDDVTTFQGLLEQPLTTGDTIYGGYRVSEGVLPDYDKNRTQEGGELLLGARLPLLRDRSIDRRRAGLRQAELDLAIAEPVIERARIDFVRAAGRAYYQWVAAGLRVVVAEDLLTLAKRRSADLQRAVQSQLLAPIDVVDNNRLLAQRAVFVARAERQLQQAALELSLFLRGPDDAPIVPESKRLPPGFALPQIRDLDAAQELALASQWRPELRRLDLQRQRAETDLALADNQAWPNVDLIVEATRALGDDPYRDLDRNGLFVGGELKFPVRRREALGRAEQARAQLSRLQLEQRWAYERIANELADARSALGQARAQLQEAERSVALAGEVVAAEERALLLGRSNLLQVQLREAQLADARLLAVDAQLEYCRAHVDYRAALGRDALPQTNEGRTEPGRR